MTARRIAQQILTAEGFDIDGREARVPPLGDLAILARDYLRRTEASGPSLAEHGPVYVSHAAAVEYARSEDLGTEPARRELTELLLDARHVGDDESHWRARRRSTDLDITVRVARDGRLLVVTHVSVRSRGGGQRRIVK